MFLMILTIPLCVPALYTQQRTTYDDYSPVGILKNNWLAKHSEELPALVGFFFDLDWEDPQWDERQTECISKIEVIRFVLFQYIHCTSTSNILYLGKWVSPNN